jgi:hypothetical protein
MVVRVVTLLRTPLTSVLIMQVPSDVLDDAASVARTLRDLSFEQPLAEADAVAHMHEQMKAMQSSWQTSSVHETLRRLLLEQGTLLAHHTFTPPDITLLGPRTGSSPG